MSTTFHGSLSVALLLLLLLLLFQPIQVLAHIQAVVQTNNGTDNGAGNGSGGGGSGNETSQQTGRHEDGGVGTIAAEFMKWIGYVAGLQHSPFPVASNKYKPTLTVTVDPRASDGFTSIQAAIDSVPIVNQVRVVIKVKPGVYKEKIIISPLRAYITIQGSGAGDTVVQWGGDGAQHRGAFDSATVAVNAPNFIARNITFKNTNSKAEGGHGVALRVSGDTASFTGCRFMGTSNTLYDHIGRHYYKDCWIEGAADFIFGQALSMFKGCKLSAVADVVSATNAITGLLNNAGMSFHDCKLTGAALAYLGRAWGTFSRVVIANSTIDHLQLPKGFEITLGPKTQMHVFFGVYNCSGPGADFLKKSLWSKQLNLSQVLPFTSLKFIDGHEWIKHP